MVIKLGGYHGYWLSHHVWRINTSDREYLLTLCVFVVQVVISIYLQYRCLSKLISISLYDK